MSVTLQHVALEAGVSLYTASCALRGAGRVAPATAQRVREVAVRLEYTPHSAARLLRNSAKRSRALERQIRIAWLHFLPRTDYIENKATLFVQQARRRGFDAEVFRWVEHDPDCLGRMLWTQGFQGIVVDAQRYTENDLPKTIARFPWDKFAAIKLTRGLDELELPVVRVSAFESMLRCLETAAVRGYRRIGVVRSPSSSRIDDQARLGAILSFRASHEAAGGEVQSFDAPSLSPSHQLPAGMTRWLSAYRPEALIAFPAGWILRFLELGYRFPQDMGFASAEVPRTLVGFKTICSGVGSDFATHLAPTLIDSLEFELLQRGHGQRAEWVERLLHLPWQEGDTLPWRQQG